MAGLTKHKVRSVGTGRSLLTNLVFTGLAVTLGAPLPVRPRIKFVSQSSPVIPNGLPVLLLNERVNVLIEYTLHYGTHIFLNYAFFAYL